MSKVGDLLKSKREVQGLSVGDISARTAIRSYIIEILEQGNFNELPSYVHAHGFLEQYSKVLGLNFAEEVKPLFIEECNKDLFGKTKEEIAIENDMKPDPSKSSKVQVALFLLVILVAVGIFAFFNFSKKNETTFTEEPVSVVITTIQEDIIEVVTQPNDAMVEVVEEEDIQQEPEAILHKASLIFSDLCWVFLVVDGATGVEFTAQPGDIKTIVFTEYFKADFGNSQAAKVVYKDQVFNNFGPQNVLVRNNYFDFDTEGKMKYSRRR